MRSLTYSVVHTLCFAWSTCNTVETSLLMPQHGKTRSLHCMLSGKTPCSAQFMSNFCFPLWVLSQTLIFWACYAFECALCRVVSGAVRTRALQSEPMKDAATQADAQQTSAFLVALFGGICSGMAPHPALANAVAHCIGDYAAWFGRAQAPLQPALQQLLGCMAIPEAAQSAATAFRNLCVRCGSQLSSHAVLAPLILAARAALSRPGMSQIFPAFLWLCRELSEQISPACTTTPYK